jgi:hypothetical protein
VEGRSEVLKAWQKLGVNHFEGLFKEPKRMNLDKTLKVISHFPRMINEDLYILVNKEELVVVLQYFRKDKSPRPHGWSVEFYLELFEFLGDELLSGEGGKNFQKNDK